MVSAEMLVRTPMKDGSGPVYRAPIQGPRDDRPLGYVEIDVDFAIRRYRTLSTWRDCHRYGPDATDALTDEDIAPWVAAATRNIGFRFAPEVDLAVHLARHAEKRANRPEPQPRELLEQIAPQAKRMSQTYRGLAGIGLLNVLGLPASTVLGPDRARLDIGDTRDAGDEEPSLLQYVALAIERGEAAALDDIVRWLRQNAKKGPKQYDWSMILRTYRYTALALRAFRLRWRQGLVADDRDRPLLERLKNAGFDIGTVAEQNPGGDFGTARQVVALEFKVKSSTIVKMWKKRATLLPKEDRLLPPRYQKPVE
jgi:hypothetical protein